MKTIDTKDYKRFNHCAECIDICRVFPLSVTEGYQSGSIYESQNCILIRHRNNFTFISGTPDESEIIRIHDLILAEELKFLCNDSVLCEALQELGGVELIPRDIYSYPSDTAPVFHLPDGFELGNIGRELFQRITGRVVPSMYWDSYEQFRRNGLGTVIMYGGEPASWAFSSAMSSNETDIGIETAGAYQHRGLAYAAAAALIGDILPSRRPTWTCQRSNLGSARTAEKLGFVRTNECVLIRGSV